MEQLSPQIAHEIPVETSLEPKSSQGFEITQPTEFNAQYPTPKGRVTVTHVLRFPTEQETAARDKYLAYRSRETKRDGQETDEILNADVDTKEAALYDKLVLRTKGYRVPLTDGADTITRQNALRTIRASHKAPVVRALLNVSAKAVVTDEVWDDADAFVDFDAEPEYKIAVTLSNQDQSQFSFSCVLPSDKALSEYRATSSVFDVERGVRKPVTTITVALPASIKFFDETVVGADGLLVHGEKFDARNPSHLSLIPAFVKRAVATELARISTLDLGN